MSQPLSEAEEAAYVARASIAMRAANPLNIAYPLNTPKNSELRSFFHAATGIQDPDALEKHLVAMQLKGYDVFPWPCIRVWSFLRLKTAIVPYYKEILSIGRADPNAKFVEIGCFCGTDMRKLLYDGYPAENILGVDVKDEWFTMGFDLFKDKETCGLDFIVGDILKDTFFDFNASPAVLEGPIPKDITTLTPLAGSVRFVAINLVIHLFPEAGQLDLARRLAKLLSPIPGSAIVGVQLGSPPGSPAQDRHYKGIPRPVFCHSPESWKDLWETEIFPASRNKDAEGPKVQADVRFQKMGDFGFSGDAAEAFDVISWSVVVV